MSRLFDANTEEVVQGSAAFPTTGSLFFWWYPTFTIADGVGHAPFRIAKSGPVQLFDFVKWTDDNLYVGWYDNADDDRIIVTASTYLTINTWHSCVVVWTISSTTQCWINGSSIGSTATLSADWNTAGIDRCIGRDGDAADHGSVGRVAEYAVWDAALSSTERTALDNGQSPLLVKPNSLTDYLPLWGDHSPEINLAGGTQGTVTGATKADHPQIGYPSVAGASF